MEKLLKILLDRSHELERKRINAIARQNWAKAIEVEARLDENDSVRKQLVELVAEKERKEWENFNAKKI